MTRDSIIKLLDSRILDLTLKDNKRISLFLNREIVIRIPGGVYMIHSKQNRDLSRGGFQNRDIGRTNFDNDFGPEFGIDYARYVDVPDLKADKRLEEHLAHVLSEDFSQDAKNISYLVRNGFVILKGKVQHQEMKNRISKKVSAISGVIEVINQISC